MKNSLRDDLINAKRENEVAYVNILNDGTITTDTYAFSNRIKDFSTKESLKLYESTLINAARFYSTKFEFDSIEMLLYLGLVFKSKDIDENEHVKEGAKPLKNIVRFYTGPVNVYLDGERKNDINVYETSVNFQGYANYNDFVEMLEEEGIKFDGPMTFEDFVCAMSCGEAFDIKTSISLKEKDNQHSLKRK